MTRAFRTGTRTARLLRDRLGQDQYRAPGADGRARRADQDRAGVEERKNPAQPQLPQPQSRRSTSPPVRSSSIRQCRDWPRASVPGSPRSIRSVSAGRMPLSCSKKPPAATETAGEPELALFTLSARTDAALRASIERHLAWLARDRTPLPDICFTSTSGRAHFPVRFAAVVGSKEQLRDALAAEAANGAALATDRRAPARLSVLRAGVAISRAWARSSIAISQYSARKSIAAPSHRRATVWSGRS